MNPLTTMPRFLPALLLLWTAGLPLLHAAQPHLPLLPAPVDLRADAMQSDHQGKPVVILFSMPDCPYCKVVRENYLAPLLRQEPAAQRPIIREVDVSGSTRFTGFDGKQLTHREFASAYGVYFAPSVIFLDAKGKPLAEPLVGGDTAGMYGAYFDRSMAEAVTRLGASRPNEKKENRK